MSVTDIFADRAEPDLIMLESSRLPRTTMPAGPAASGKCFGQQLCG
jgi:hypothetical protein